MAVPFAQHAFTMGEVAPGLFGRQDLARYHVGASTMRNMWPKYSGGAYSRAGTAFVGFSAQTRRSYPPRLVPFQFSINQGLALEFGNFYMRVVKNGAYVTETPLPISGISNSNPAVVTMTANGVTGATPNNGAVTASYAPGDLIALAGGTYSLPGVLSVTTTELLSLSLFAAGSGVYAPADTIALTGGTQTVPAQLTVTHTQVVSATIAAGGAGGTNGTATVTGTTGTGTLFQANVTISGGAITAVNSISLAGDYTVNPAVPAAEPVVGAALVGAQLNLSIGVLQFSITAAGTFTANPSGFTFTQASTSGTGTGAKFSSALMGIRALGVSSHGSYTANPANPVAQAFTTGSGLGATYNVIFASGLAPYSTGDWVNLASVFGMTEVNGQTYVITVLSATTFSLQDVYGNNIDSTAFGVYAGAGTTARIYTTSAPYSEVDLRWLKWTQSADVMSICCVNQETLNPYPAYDLTRLSDTIWQFNVVAPGPTVGNPTASSAAMAGGAGNTFYQYVTTAVNPADGTESLPSPIAQVDNAIDISSVEGSVVLSWSGVAGVTEYRVYKASPTFFTPPSSGSPFGLLAIVVNGANGYADSGAQLPDFNVVPPTFNNPFLLPAGTPGVVSYFQERRVYAFTLGQPDTYFMSQPGSFTNFDIRTPAIDSDAIIGAPWAVKVDGIQWMIDMPGGLVVLTGDSAWQLTGAGGSSLNPQPITPAAQQAQPQAFNGIHNHVPPIKIDYDILYVQAKGSNVRDLSYQFYQNIYTGIDLTLTSSHLFTGHQIQEWAWVEEPYKIVWAVRDDGTMLSLTYVKPEQIAAWARHDTQGSFKSVCSVTELPVDALYTAAQRKIGTHTAYTIERMDNRIWNTIDDAWCVDCGASLPQPEPAAALSVSSPTGGGLLVNPVVLDGGAGWSAGTVISVVDNNGLGPGTGAAFTPVIVGGVITGLAEVSPGSGYVRPQFHAFDPAGSEGGDGFSATCSLQNTVALTASAGVFSIDNVGSVVRVGGGIGPITAYSSPTQVTANMVQPVVSTIPDDATPDTFPFVAGTWSMTAPVTKVHGLNFLIGATVTGVADGQVIPAQVVASDGSITLAHAATNVVAGLAFTAQLQSLYLETQSSPTVQGQRKKIAAVTAQMEASRAFQVGSNQPDGSTLSPQQLAPVWSGMVAAPDQVLPKFGSTLVPLWTGQVRIPLEGGFDTKGQVALQQTSPLPMAVLALINEDWEGDTPQSREPGMERDKVPA